MLVSSKWQTMWMESQNCANNVVNISVPSQQAEKILEDVRLNCGSPKKEIQLEALKCWGSWISNQNPDDWKSNSVCYTAIRPLLMKKLQPLNKDVDICKLKLSLMWKLLGKVQHMMHLEGPQYILEVFLQSCLMWLSSTDEVDNEISILIFQLFLSLFKKTDELIKCDKEMFPLLTEDILKSKKAFQRHVDKFLSVVVRWRKLSDKTLLLVVWKCFLEHCERFCDNIPIRIWHEVFKTVGQICSETRYSLKERLAFLHGCATTLDSVLSSSKFIDFGNLLTTPCEALLKKLLELSVGTAGEEDESVQSEGEVFDADMFAMSRDVCHVLSAKSVLLVSGYDLCNYVLDGLEDSTLKSMFWGVWCGLVHCYKTQLSHVDRNKLAKTEMKFYRRLRGVAVNFDLDRQDIDKDCASEVEALVEVLNISCFCKSKRSLKPPVDEKPEPRLEATDVVEVNTRRREDVPGRFSTVAIYRPKRAPPSSKFLTLNFDVVKDVLNTLTVLHGKSLLEGLFGIRFLSLKKAEGHEMVVGTPAIGFRKKAMTGRDRRKSPPKLWYSVAHSTIVKPREKPKERKERSVGRKKEVRTDKMKREREDEKEGDVNSTPKTRSQRKAEVEEEKRRKESIGCQTRRRRKSFEILVQEIVKKNKLRKTEKSVRRKSPVMVGKREKVSRGKKEMKENDRKTRGEKKVVKVPRDVKAKKVESPKTEKGKKVKKVKEIRKDGKLENYFKVLRKTRAKSEEEKKKKEVEETGKTKKKTKRVGSEKEESDKKVETGWKQTSLKSIMKPKKDQKGKPGKELKDKTPEKERDNARKEKKTKKEARRKLDEENLKNMSPFKEVLHDHEYAKTTEPEYLPGSKRIVMRRYKKPEEVVRDIEMKLEVVGSESGEKEEKGEERPVEPTSPQEGSPTVVVEPEPSPVESPVIAQTPTEPELTQKTEETDKIDSEVTKDEVKPLQEVEEPSKDNKSRKRKRPLTVDSVKPKRQKKEEGGNEEEETATEVSEKENMDVMNVENKPEVNVTPTKEGILSEKTVQANSRPVGSDVSPITSRALRMIALLPETTKGGQVHRDSTGPKTETKSVKGTNVNVDRSSRASKMLALISENVVRAGEEPMDWNDDVSEAPTTKPSVTTPVSIVSSPKAVKKRKSIRFDEAKNETFMYQIGTPPSQIWRKCDG